MAKRLIRDHIAQKGFLDGPKEEFKSLLDLVGNLKGELGELAKLFSGKLQQANKETAEGIEQINLVTEELLKLKKDNEKLTKSEEKLKKKLNKIAEAENKLKEQLVKSTDEEVKGKIRLQKANREQKRQLEAELILRNEQVETLQDVRERIKALRIVTQQQSINTEEGRNQIKAYNDEINELTDTLKENSDTFIQNKINIGNYTDSVREAIDTSELLGKELGILGGIASTLVTTVVNLNKATDENTEALKDNSKGVAALARRWKALNTTLKASIIGAIIAAVLALGAAFGQGQQGAINLRKAFLAVQVVAKSLLTVILNVGSGLIDFFKGFGGIVVSSFNTVVNNFAIFGARIQLTIEQIKDGIPGVTSNVEQASKALDDLKLKGSELGTSFDESINNLKTGFFSLTGAFSTAKDVFTDGFDAISDGFDDLNRQFERGFELQELTTRVADLNGELEKTQQIADDDTLALRRQLEANEESLEIAEKLVSARNEVAAIGLRNANAETRLILQQNEAALERLGIDRGRIDNLINLQKQEATGQRLLENQIQFTREFLQLSRETAGEGTFLPTPEELQPSIDALNEAIETSKSGEAEIQEINTKTRLIQRDLFEQNLDLLIDLIDKEKSLSEQFVRDTTRNFETRVTELNNFINKFSDNLQKELDEFNKNTEARGLDIPLQVEFSEEEGLKVFLDDSELALDNITELNKQLQGAGFSEIEINRFREFVQDAQDGRRDFTDLRKEIQQAKRELSELSDEEIVTEAQLNAVEGLAQKFPEIFTADVSALSQEEIDNLLQQIEEFEDDKTLIEEQAQEQRRNNRIKAIDLELQTVEEGSEREVELQIEKNKLLLEAEESRIEQAKDLNDQLLARQKEIEDAQVEQAQDTASRLRDIAQVTDAIFAEIFDRQQKRLDAELAANQENQNKLVEAKKVGSEEATQSLAFEIQREDELQREQQKLEERRQKIELATTALQTYASNLENPTVQNPLQKTFTDIIKLRTFIAALPAFWEGSERIGDSLGAIMPGRDGVIARIDKDERIMTVEQNNKLGGMSNELLADVGQKWMKGELVDAEQALNYPVAMVEPKSNDSNQLTQLIKEVRSLPDRMPTSGIEDFDELAKIIKFHTKKGNKKKTTLRRIEDFMNG